MSEYLLKSMRLATKRSAVKAILALLLAATKVFARFHYFESAHSLSEICFLPPNINLKTPNARVAGEKLNRLCSRSLLTLFINSHCIVSKAQLTAILVRAEVSPWSTLNTATVLLKNVLKQSCRIRLTWWLGLVENVDPANQAVIPKRTVESKTYSRNDVLVHAKFLAHMRFFCALGVILCFVRRRLWFGY